MDTGEPVRAFLAAGDGVFYVPEDEASPDRPFADAPLWFVTPGGERADTGLTAEGGEVGPDGVCTQVRGTTDQRVLLPLGTRPTYVLNLVGVAPQ